MGLLQRFAGLDRDEGVLQAVPASEVVVDVIGRDDGDAELLPQRDEASDAIVVAEDEVVLQLEVEVVGAKPVQVPFGRGLRFLGAAGGDQGGDFARAAAGKRNQSQCVIS